jgi:hypothetical protein
MYVWCESGAKTPKKGEQVITKATPAQILASLVLSCPARFPRRMLVSWYSCLVSDVV